MKRIYLKSLLGYLVLQLLSPILLASNGPIPLSMAVITAADKPLQHQTYIQKIIEAEKGKFSVYLLNSISDFEKQISQGLPADKEKAEQIFQQRLDQIGEEVFKQQIIAAYQALLQATQYQIDRYPAIIFDKQAVIYGVTDLKIALQKYHQWKIREQSIQGAEIQVKATLPFQGETP